MASRRRNDRRDPRGANVVNKIGESTNKRDFVNNSRNNAPTRGSSPRTSPGSTRWSPRISLPPNNSTSIFQVAFCIVRRVTSPDLVTLFCLSSRGLAPAPPPPRRLVVLYSSSRAFSVGCYDQPASQPQLSQSHVSAAGNNNSVSVRQRLRSLSGVSSPATPRRRGNTPGVKVRALTSPAGA